MFTVVVRAPHGEETRFVGRFGDVEEAKAAVDNVENWHTGGTPPEGQYAVVVYEPEGAIGAWAKLAKEPTPVG